MQPLISVIINCHNSATYLHEAIDSVYNQSYTNWEIIFYDNNSIDASAKIAKSYDSRLVYYHRADTINLGAARKEAISIANGEYLAFLDCDDLWLKDKLKLQIKNIEKLKEQGITVGLCYSESIRIDLLGKHLGLYSYEKKLLSGFLYTNLLEDCFIDMSTVIVNCHLFKNTGGFSCKYELVEDWDAWLKIGRKHYISFVDKPLVKTRIHTGNMSSQLFKHTKEMISLITNTSVSKSIEKKAKRNSLKKLNLRLSALIFAEAMHYKTKRLKTLFKFITDLLKSPIISFKFLKRHLNYRIFTLLKIRVGNNPQ